MASVCDPLTGQCHCKVSRGLYPRLLPTYLLQLSHGPPQRPSWAGGAFWMEALGDKDKKWPMVWLSTHSQLALIFFCL